MKAVYVIKSTGYRDVVECASVQEALHNGQRHAVSLGNRNATLEVYELVATGKVQTESTIKIEKAVKP